MFPLVHGLRRKSRCVFGRADPSLRTGRLYPRLLNGTRRSKETASVVEGEPIADVLLRLE